MGEYADAKRKRILQLLKWLGTLRDIEVDTAGKHQWIVKHVAWKRPYPIPFKRNIVSNVYIKKLVKLVVATGACTKQEFDAHL